MYTVFRNLSYYTKVADLFKGPFNADMFASLNNIEKSCLWIDFVEKFILFMKRKIALLRVKWLKAYY